MATRALSLLAVASAAHASAPARYRNFHHRRRRCASSFAGSAAGCDRLRRGRERRSPVEIARRSTPDEAAACYAARYPDLRAAFCEKDRCNARQARAHFREFGKREGRKFGCDKGLKPKVLPGWGFEQAYALSCDGPCDVGRAASLDIVVAAFEHGTAPVVRAVAASLPAHVAPVRAFLYYKKGIDAVDVSHVRAIKRVSHVEAVSLPNVGRCDHAYATHAMRRHNDLADATLFLKDTTPWHVHLGSMVNVLGLTRALPANLEAFCARSPIDETPASEPVFELPTYESEQCRRFSNCYADESYKRAAVRPLGRWLAQHVEHPIGERGVAACLGGAFGAGRDAIRRTPAATYQALASELSAGDSLEAGHFAERAWLALFGVSAKPKLVRNRGVVYAIGGDHAAGLDRSLDLDTSGRDAGWDYLYFVSPNAGLRAPRGWRLVATPRLDELKAAPHRDPRLSAYAHSLYVEARPDVVAAQAAVATALSAGASVALRRRAGFHRRGAPLVEAHMRGRRRAEGRAVVGGATGRAARAGLLRRAAARAARGPAYASTFVLRRHTEAAAAFGERWLARLTELGPDFADAALMAAAAASGSTIAAADEALVDERPGAGAVVEAVRRRPPQTWVFLATADSSAAWATMAKKAVASARARTSLKHIVCVFRGSKDAALARWFERAGVEVLYHDKPAWAPRVAKALSTDAGRSNIQFSPLYASAAALTATFLRVDIPMLLDPTRHGEVVLYADADLVFLRDVRREDFGAGADPAYFTMGAEFAEPPIYGNAGVMLLSLEGLRKTYDQFVDWTFSEANVQRGLHFGDFGPGDQGAYAEFYEGAFTIVRGQPLFNWRPYWRSRRADPAILHFHGPKPDQYRAGLGGRWEAPWDTWPPLQRCRRQGSPCSDWLKVYDCLPEEVGAVPSPECEKLLAPSFQRTCVPLEATAACTARFTPPNPYPSAKAFWEGDISQEKKERTRAERDAQNVKYELVVACVEVKFTAPSS